MIMMLFDIEVVMFYVWFVRLESPFHRHRSGTGATGRIERAGLGATVQFPRLL